MILNENSSFVVGSQTRSMEIIFQPFLGDNNKFFLVKVQLLVRTFLKEESTAVPAEFFCFPISVFKYKFSKLRKTIK